jgi:cytosine/adenosine deaminase-related metal-dependent hydrolase
MKYVKGQIFQEHPEDAETGFDFIRGYLGFENGEIFEVVEGNIPAEIDEKDVMGKGIIIPTFTNPHTHIGDSIAKGIKFTEPVTIESLLAPPDGMKHRILRESSETDLINAMRVTLDEMIRAGITEFCDFRELGVKGVAQLKSALQGSPIDAKIFGRPMGLEYDEPEFDKLISEVDGIGISSISDYKFEDLVKISNCTKNARKDFALHASERVREDLVKVLELKPDFIVHMTKGIPEDFQTLAELDIPVITCPRSNLFFQNTPNIAGMLNYKLTIALGTDNVMLNQPDIFNEMRAAYSILNNQWDKKPINTAREILKMGVLNPRKVLNHKYPIPHPLIQVGAEAKFILIEIPYKEIEPEQLIVNEAEISDISVISIGQKLLWTKNKSFVQDQNQ